MKYILFSICLSFFCLSCLAQSFEGEIVYQNAYRSKFPNLSDLQLTTLLGSIQDYYIKDGNYKSETNGALLKWQLYINADNKLYNKFSKSDTLQWNDASVNKDSVLSIEKNLGVTEILGYKCNELVLNCKNGMERFYFSDKLPVDSKLFINHALNNWYAYLSKANALPLKIIIDNYQFTMVSIATEIKPVKLDKAMFILPAGTKSIKSQY